MCLLSAEGDVVFLDDQDVFERIPGAGIKSPDSKRWGRMASIAGIGNGLFACGDGGQIYSRETDGSWRNLAPELLQTPGTYAIPDYDMFNALAGSSEDDVYVAGRFGKIFHWNGERVRPVQSPTRSHLVSAICENKRSFWISGADGTLLNGNKDDAFRKVAGIGEEHHLNSVAIYQGKLYLASALGWIAGIHTYANGRFEKVVTGLKPEPRQISYVDTGAGVL